MVAAILSMLDRMRLQTAKFGGKTICWLLLLSQLFWFLSTEINLSNGKLTLVESRTTNVPGAAFRNNSIASSREIVGLYQNFDESRANLREKMRTGKLFRANEGK